MSGGMRAGSGRDVGVVRDVAFCTAGIALAAWVWAPLRDNYWFFDDFALLYDSVNQPLGRFLIGIQGGHLYVVRNLVALATVDAFGPEPSRWFLVVIATHLANVALSFMLVRRLCGSPALGAAAAALWAVAPVQEGTLGWYSVYGQVLATTVLLVLLLDLERAATAGAVGAGRLAVWWVLALVETNLFGTGIGVALALPVVAWLVLPPGCRWRAGGALIGLWVVVPALYVTQNWLWVRYGGGVAVALPVALDMAQKWDRDVTMLRALFGNGIASIVLNVFLPVRDSAVAPVAAAYGLVVGGAIMLGDARMRRWTIALAIVAAAAYGMIAAGRSVYLVALQGATGGDAARYHYLATVPLVTILALAAGRLAAASRAPARLGDVAAAGVLIALAAGVARGDWRIDHHAAARQETAAALAEIAAEATREPPGRFVRIPNRPFASVGPFFGDMRFPGWAALFAIFNPDDRVAGRVVRFVDARGEVLRGAREGRRSAHLIVPE